MPKRLVHAFPLLLLVAAPVASEARDNGQYANVAPEIRAWVESLKDGEGVGCCATADGVPLDEPDWQMNADGYRVKIEGKWYDVPKRAVITEPNKLGHAVVWYFWRYDYAPTADGSAGSGTTGEPYIRCFIPGTSM